MVEATSGVRSGTLNVSSIVGLGAACAIAKQEMEAEGTPQGTPRQAKTN